MFKEMARMSPPTDPIALDGLDDEEARRRLAQFGPNVLQGPGSRNLVQIVRGTLREPMFLFLLLAALIYLFIGDLGEGVFLVVAALVSIGLVVFQEARSERALAALQRLAEPFARVIRNGSERRLPARDLVPGDVLLVGEGERLPADGVLVAGDVLTIDESALTGESVPVSKTPALDSPSPIEHPSPGGEGTPFLFAGTLIVGGQGVARVLHTGASTALGKIGASLATLTSEPTLLQRTTARLIARLAILAVLFCIVVFVAYGLLRGDWVEGALAGITLAISLMPEEFPMVLAVFMALGAWRLAGRRVLVRRAATIETLGAATMLCVDKTGTLTENRMKLAALWLDGGMQELAASGALDHDAALLVGKAALASAFRPVDPMDRAIREFAEELGGAGGSSSLAMPLRTYPLRPGLLAVIQVWSLGEGRSVLAAKGAPEAIFRLCRVGADAEEQLLERVAAMAARGLRVLGVASCEHAGAVPDDPAEETFTFEGLIGFVDPVRKDVPAALAEASRAGIKVAMITGDYPATALEIARQSGIDTDGGVLTGADIDGLAGIELREAVKRVRVFARIRPEQKLALVEAFKANGEIVVMTGDGINDAPALEASDIGIAMGQRGTDVAREAADLVLLDDSFASIVGGVRLGRRIFANLRKALIYVAAIHVPTAGLALLPILMGLPPILFPMHVVLLELVIDPVCSLVFEAEPSEKGAMTRPPRSAKETLFSRRQFGVALVQGGIVLGAVLALYVLMLEVGLPDTEARAMAFVALIIANLVLAFADSAEVGTAFFDRRRIAFWAIGTTAAAILALVLYVPALARIFVVSPPKAPAMALALAVALLAGGWFGVLRRAGIMRSAV
jgi:Ca2+-transporting ATPase